AAMGEHSAQFREGIEAAQKILRSPFVPNRVADGRKELMSFGGGLKGLPDSARNLSLYKDSKGVLLLADAERGNHMGTAIAREHPTVPVVSTDLNYAGRRVEGNLTTMRLDNSGKFPFPDNSFTHVVLQKGMCGCTGTHRSCGGIAYTPECLTNFFSEVTRVLDKNNPKSVAILNGWIPDAGDFETFRLTLMRHLSRVGLRAELVEDASGAVHTVRIFP
ncbi:MAG TPA: hypothetical protein VFV50_17430, partial [Bdellovibrionales bacterium]|nr:hypothetical protein [Bdellovibrionales bacterium]